MRLPFCSGAWRPERLLPFLSLAVIGCGAAIQPPVVPHTVADSIRDGDIDGALEACRAGDCTSEQKTAVARMVFAQKKPALELHVLSDDEVLARFGGRNARHILRQHLALESKVIASTFDGADVTLLAESDAGTSSLVESDPEHLTLLTGERYPAPHEWSEWHVMDVPYPNVSGLGSLALAVAELMIVGPFQLLTLHKETHYRPPTDEEVRAAVPLAVKLRDAIASKHERNTFAQTFFIGRPLHDGPIAIKGTIELKLGGNALGTRFRSTLDAKDAHVDLADGDEFALEAFPKESCTLPDCAFAPLPTAKQVTIGLAVPEIPKELGTPEASDKAKPYWTSTTYAPAVAFGGPTAAKDEEGRLVVCRMSSIEVPGEDADDVYARVTIGQRSYRRYPMGWMSFPLVRVAPGSTFSISLWDQDWFSGDDWLSTVSFRRSGANLVRTVSPRYAETDLACTVHGRNVVEDEVLTRWLTAMDELETMERIVRVDLGKPKFGLERRKTAIDAIEGMAGFVGWDDPRVRPLVDRIAANEKTFGVATKAALEGWAQRHPTAALAIKGVRCDKAAKIPSQRPEYEHTKCVVDVEVDPAANLHDLRIVMTDGRTVNADLVMSQSIAIPREIPAIGENEKPWAVVFVTTELGVVRVP